MDGRPFSFPFFFLPMRHLSLFAALSTPALLLGCAGQAAMPMKATAPDHAFHITTTAYPQIQGNQMAGWWKDRFEAKCKIAEAGGFDVLFVGDSITHSWEKGGKAVWDRDIAPLKAANFGYSGDRTENVLWRFDHGELSGKIDPKVVVIMIGTNNTGHRMDQPADIASGVGAIVDRLTARFPQAQVVLLDIFPRGEKTTDGMRVNNAKTNELIAKLDGSAGGRVHFFPIGDKFLTADGTLSKDIMPDLLHPNAKGYEIWSAAVVPEIKKLLGK